MTFEEMQKIIQEMLSVQRDLRETQIKQQGTAILRGIAQKRPHEGNVELLNCTHSEFGRIFI